MTSKRDLEHLLRVEKDRVTYAVEAREAAEDRLMDEMKKADERLEEERKKAQEAQVTVERLAKSLMQQVDDLRNIALAVIATTRPDGQIELTQQALNNVATSKLHHELDGLTGLHTFTVAPESAVVSKEEFL